ncbi:hypothetical protein ACHAWX_002985 [Stephanocyclus meneghinianus]
MSQQIAAKEQTPILTMESDTRYTEIACSKPGSYTVPTLFRKPAKQINLMDLRVADLSSLKEDDPFLYYSIPAVRKSAMHGFVAEESNTNAPASSWNSRSPVMRSISFDSIGSHDPMEMDENDEDVDIEIEEIFIPSCQVTRKSCISFESPNIMVPDDPYALGSAVSASNSPEDENDEDEYILSFLSEKCTTMCLDM